LRLDFSDEYLVDGLVLRKSPGLVDSATQCRSVSPRYLSCERRIQRQQTFTAGSGKGGAL